MKTTTKTITIILFSLLSFYANAQLKNISIKADYETIAPGLYKSSVVDGGTFNLIYSLTNEGSKSIIPSDSIVVLFSSDATPVMKVHRVFEDYLAPGESVIDTVKDILVQFNGKQIFACYMAANIRGDITMDSARSDNGLQMMLSPLVLPKKNIALATSLTGNITIKEGGAFNFDYRISNMGAQGIVPFDSISVQLMVDGKFVRQQSFVGYIAPGQTIMDTIRQIQMNFGNLPYIQVCANAYIRGDASLDSNSKDNGACILAIKKTNTGISENTTAKVSIFPNPSGSIFNFNLADKEANRIIIRNMEGKEVGRLFIINGKATWDVTLCKNGIYFYETETAGGDKLFSGRLIVIHQ